MVSLSPTQPYIVVAIGPPGSGKSFFARRFAEMFNAPLISFDEIRSELFNEILYSEDENIIVARMAGLQLRELLRTKKTVVIDGGHNAKISRQELAKVVRPLGYKVLNVWVQTDERTARNRSIKRKKAQPEDSYNRALDETEFVSQSKKFTPPSKYEEFVVISGRHTYPTQARIVLKRMASVHAPASAPVPPRSDIRPPQQGRRSVRVDS